MRSIVPSRRRRSGRPPSAPRCWPRRPTPASAGCGFPVHHRQVNERWLDQYRPWVYGAGFGWQIGTGLATYITTAAVYLMVVLGALTGRPAAALAVGTGFGLVRGLAVLLTRNLTDPAALLDVPPAVRAPVRADRWSGSMAAVAVALAVATVVGRGRSVLLVGSGRGASPSVACRRPSPWSVAGRPQPAARGHVLRRHRAVSRRP